MGGGGRIACGYMAHTQRERERLKDGDMKKGTRTETEKEAERYGESVREIFGPSKQNQITLGSLQ